MVELVRIRILADAGVPLSRVRELLSAGDPAFAEAVKDNDRRLRAEIHERKQHREWIARLASGESLALPPEAVAYLDRMRELGFGERLVDIERDSWILISAQIPDEVADRVVVFIEAAAVVAQALETGVPQDHLVSDELAHLLDSGFCETFPWATRLLELLDERGWTGWTNIRRKTPQS